MRPGFFLDATVRSYMTIDIDSIGMDTLLSMTQYRPAPALEDALRARFARPSARAAEISADVVFDAGSAGVWTVRLRNGRADLRSGRALRASATLSADPETMLAAVEGRTVGIDAFLRGQLTFRGNIALALELDDLFHPSERGPRAPRARRVEVGGLTTFFLEAGPPDAPPVVMLHGLGATSASFLPSVWALSTDHRVIAMDLPGFGESGKPLCALRPAFFAEHVIGLLDALAIPRAHLLGNSLGGRVAIEVGLRAPERVGKLALLAPSLAWRRFRFAVRIVSLLRHELGLIPIPVLRWIVLRVLDAMFAVPERASPAAMDAAADEFLRVFSTARGRIAFLSATREIYLEDPFGSDGFWERLRELERPALFVFGAKDRLVPRGFAKHVRETVPGARCEILDDCGHVPQFEMPDRTHALVRSFFAERPSRRRSSQWTADDPV
ncbi:MAG: alpha/beta fold hydrolase [Polyangiales bacterium]